MLPACRTGGEGFAIPPFDLVPSDVEGFMEALWEFQSTFHDCFARSEPRGHFFDYMVGQFSKLGIHAKRDKLPSIAYSEELSFSRSATLQSTDRHHGIVGQERCHFQLDS